MLFFSVPIVLRFWYPPKGSVAFFVPPSEVLGFFRTPQEYPPHPLVNTL
jgi:hypothetical protein